jgi:ribonuclease E
MDEPQTVAAVPRRRSTIREPAPLHGGAPQSTSPEQTDHRGAAEPAHVADPAHATEPAHAAESVQPASAVETAAPAAPAAEAERSDQPRRTGWWARRFAGDKS